MSSDTDCEEGTANIGLIGLWFRKILYEGNSDETKREWLGEEFIKYLTDKKHSCVFLHSKNLPLPIDEVYEMIKKEKEVLAFLEEPVDLDNFTMDDLACGDCEKSNEKIKELQKVLEKQGDMITSKNKLIKDFQTYLQFDIPKLIEKVITHYDKEKLNDIICETETIDNIDVHHKDSFLNSNKILIWTVQNSISTLMSEYNSNHSLEVNQLQDKVLELQKNIANYQRTNSEIQEKLKKYKLNCVKLKTENDKLSLFLDEQKETFIQKVNKDLKEGKLSVHLMVKDDRRVHLTDKKDNPIENEQIGDCLQK